MMAISSPEELFRSWLLLFRTRDAIYRAREKELNEYDLSPRQAAILRIVKLTSNAATPSEIARRLFRKPHSISGIAIRMEKQGLLKRVKDLDRKNLVRIALTEQGDQAYQQTVERKSVHRIMSALSEEQRHHLVSCLETLWYAAQKELRVNEKPPAPLPDVTNEI